MNLDLLDIYRDAKKSFYNKENKHQKSRHRKVLISMPNFNQNSVHFLLTKRSIKENEYNIN